MINNCCNSFQMDDKRKRERENKRKQNFSWFFLTLDFGEVIKHMSLLNEFYHVWILRCSD